MIMKISIGNLRKIIKEEVQKTGKFEVVIDQDRDQFTDMMGGGNYYEDMGWPGPSDDPNCETYQFDDESDALKFADQKSTELNNLSDDPGSILYRSLVYKVGPRGKKTLVKEFE